MISVSLKLMQQSQKLNIKFTVILCVQNYKSFVFIMTKKYQRNIKSYSKRQKHFVSLLLSAKIYYSCVFGKRNYRVLVRVCVCVCVSVFVCVCVCVCMITQKDIDLGTRNRNTLKYMKIARTSSILSLVGSRSRSL